MPQPSQAHVHVCMDMHSKAKHTDIPTGCLQASVQVQDAGSGSLKLFLDSDRSRRACDDSDLHWAVFPPFKLRLQNSVNWLLNWWDNEHYGGPESCADLPLSQWHALLAPFPIVKCTIASPPLDAGVPCVQRGGKKKNKTGYLFLGNIYSRYTQYRGSCNLCLLICLLLSFPLTYCVLGGCVCYYKVYWNINIYF